MPKKTKKEKLIAQYRRKLTTLVTDTPVAKSPKAEPKSSEPLHTPYTYTAQSSQPQKTRVLSLQTDDFVAIKKDLAWTLCLCTFIIIGEIVLWRVVG